MTNCTSLPSTAASTSPPWFASQVADRSIAALVGAELLTGPGPKAANSFEQPDLVRPQPLEQVRLASGQAEIEMPPLSLVAMTFRLD